MEFDSFGEALSYFRREYKTRYGETMSQRRLGELIGYTRNMAGLWERNESKPSSDVIQRIAEALKLDGIDTNLLLTAAGYHATPLQDDEIQDFTPTQEQIRKAVKRGFGEAVEQAVVPEPPVVPIPTTVPKPRTTHFAGREEEKAWLRERLLSGGQAALAGMRGIGGIGKTELAIQVAANWWPKRFFPVVFIGSIAARVTFMRFKIGWRRH